jgi:hypothetical protein
MSGRSSDYQVGYGKPPQHTRFRKGQSGNPKGRPKGVPSLAQIAGRIFNERIVVRENGARRRITKTEAALIQLANKAASGNDRAVRDLLRVYGYMEAGALAERLPRAGTGPADVTIDEPPDTPRIALALLNILHRGRAERQPFPQSAVRQSAGASERLREPGPGRSPNPE